MLMEFCSIGARSLTSSLPLRTKESCADCDMAIDAQEGGTTKDIGDGAAKEYVCYPVSATPQRQNVLTSAEDRWAAI